MHTPIINVQIFMHNIIYIMSSTNRIGIIEDEGGF